MESSSINKQEWTAEFIGNETYGTWVVNTGTERIACGNEENAKALAAVHNTALAAERERREQAEQRLEYICDEHDRIQEQLLSAQAAIVAEPELPGNMPEQIWKAVQNDKDAAVELLRIVVRLTKQGIIERLGNPNLLDQHDADTIAPYIKIMEDAKEIIERYNDGDERPAVAALSDIEAILWKH